MADNETDDILFEAMQRNWKYALHPAARYAFAVYVT